VKLHVVNKNGLHLVGVGDVPKWKDLPSWAAIRTVDLAPGSDIVRSMAQRADATVTEVEEPDLIMMSQPDAVADVILTARRAVS
jgi:hypothetical protein